MVDNFDLYRKMVKTPTKLIESETEPVQIAPEEVSKGENNIEKEMEFNQNLNLNLFNTNGILTRKYFFFTLQIIYVIINITDVSLFFIFNQSVFYYFCCLILFITLLCMVYIATYKRLSHIYGADKNHCFFKTVFFCLPLVCLYPIFKKSKAPANLYDSKEIENSLLKLDGKIALKEFIKNNIILLASAFLFICFVSIVHQSSAVRAEYSLAKDLNSFVVVWIMMFGFNIDKFAMYGREKREEQNKSS